MWEFTRNHFHLYFYLKMTHTDQCLYSPTPPAPPPRHSPLHPVHQREARRTIPSHRRVTFDPVMALACSNPGEQERAPQNTHDASSPNNNENKKNNKNNEAGIGNRMQSQSFRSHDRIFPADILKERKPRSARRTLESPFLPFVIKIRDKQLCKRNLLDFSDPSTP